MPVTEPTSPRRLIRVLLIDDDDDTEIIIRDALDEARRHRYELTACRHPSEAAAVLESGSFDVCLLDVHFGGHDGLEFLRHLRHAGVNLPVIMFTGQKDNEVEWEAARIGADDYLDKDALSPMLLERMIVYALERRLAQADLMRKAKTDPLTGVANRIALHEYLSQALDRARRHGRQLALLLLDINGFKGLNDANGHAFGDAVLIQFAEALKNSVRTTDLVARLGGDEFVIVLDDIEPGVGVAAVRAKLAELLGKGFAIDGRRVVVAASIGAAGWPTDAATADELLACADRSMYANKQAGKRVSAVAAN